MNETLDAPIHDVSPSGDVIRQHRTEPLSVSFVLNMTGLGDGICASLTIRHYVKEHPMDVVRLHVAKPVQPYFDMFVKQVCPEVEVTTGRLNRFQHGHELFMEHPTSMSIPLTDYCSLALMDLMLKGADRDYPLLRPDPEFPRDTLPERYAVMSSHYVSSVKAFAPGVYASVVQGFKDRGVSVVVVGKEYVIDKQGQEISVRSEDKHGWEIDMTERLTVPQTHAVLSHSIGYLGMEGGLGHLAATTDIPIVLGYTTSSPDNRMSQRHGKLGWKMLNIEPDPFCRYCLNHTFKVIGQPTDQCYHDDQACANSLTFEKWEAGINWLIKQSEI